MCACVRAGVQECDTSRHRDTTHTRMMGGIQLCCSICDPRVSNKQKILVKKGKRGRRKKSGHAYNHFRVFPIQEKGHAHRTLLTQEHTHTRYTIHIHIHNTHTHYNTHAHKNPLIVPLLPQSKSLLHLRFTGQNASLSA